MKLYRKIDFYEFDAKNRLYTYRFSTEQAKNLKEAVEKRFQKKGKLTDWPSLEGRWKVCYSDTHRLYEATGLVCDPPKRLWSVKRNLTYNKYL